MPPTYNSVLLRNSPFFKELVDSEGRCRVISRDASSLSFILEELISYGVVDIAIPADSLSARALDSVSDVLKKRVKIIDKDNKIWEMDRAVREPICNEFGLRRLSRSSFTFDMELPGHVESAVCQLEDAWYDYLLGLSCKLQIDVNLNELRRSIGILREHAKTTDARSTLATFAGVLSTYEPNDVGVIQMIPQASESLVEVFEHFIEDTTYRSLSQSFHEIGFPERFKAGLSRVGTLAKRLVRKKGFKDVVGMGSKSITVATQIPLPESDLGERMLGQRYLPPIVSLEHAMEKAHQAWSSSGSDFKPIDSC